MQSFVDSSAKYQPAGLHNLIGVTSDGIERDITHRVVDALPKNPQNYQIQGILVHHILKDSLCVATITQGNYTKLFFEASNPQKQRFLSNKVALVFRDASESKSFIFLMENKNFNDMYPNLQPRLNVKIYKAKMTKAQKEEWDEQDLDVTWGNQFALAGTQNLPQTPGKSILKKNGKSRRKPQQAPIPRSSLTGEHRTPVTQTPFTNKQPTPFANAKKLRQETIQSKRKINRNETT